MTGRRDAQEVPHGRRRAHGTSGRPGKQRECESESGDRVRRGRRGRDACKRSFPGCADLPRANGVVGDTTLDDGEPDEEGRFFGGGLNTEQRVSRSERWKGFLLKELSTSWISSMQPETRKERLALLLMTSLALTCLRRGRLYHCPPFDDSSVASNASSRRTPNNEANSQTILQSTPLPPCLHPR